MRRTKDAILWVGAILGSIGIIWAVVMVLFGITPLVFTSGSMSPDIKAGDVAFSRTIDANDITKGDVVSVINAKGVRVTHRVVGVDRTDDGAVLSLKGDANIKPDAEAYNVTQVERVGVVVPKFGYVISWVNKPLAMFFGGAIVMLGLIVAFRPLGTRGSVDDDSASENNKVGSTGAKSTALTVVSILLLVTLGYQAPHIRGTTAAFTDTGAMITGNLTSSSSPPKVVGPTCSNGSIGWFGNTPLKINWSALPDQNGHKVWYRVQLADNTGFTSNSNFVEQIYNPSATREFSTTLSSHANGTYYIRVQSGYEATSGAITWLSPTYRRWTVSKSVTLGWGNLNCVSSTEV